MLFIINGTKSGIICVTPEYSCDKEFGLIKQDSEMSIYDSQFKCDSLPEASSTEDCTSIGLPPVLKRSDLCYRETGIGKFSKILFSYESCKNLIRSALTTVANRPECLFSKKFCLFI